MNLSQNAFSHYGARVRRTGIVVQKKKVTDPALFRALTARYLVDERKESYRSPEQIMALDPGGDYTEKILSGRAPLRPGIDYKAGAPKVWTFGSANHSLYFTHPKPLALDDDERLDHVVEWWLRSRTRRDVSVIAHHLVFSLDPRLTALLGQSSRTKNIPLDNLVLDAVANSLLEYQSRFYPGDQMGFMAGVHHDRAHAHAHVLVHPATALGRRVMMATNKIVELGNRRVNVQYQDHLKKSFEHYTRKLYDLAVLPEAETPGLFSAPTKRVVSEAYADLILTCGLSAG